MKTKEVLDLIISSVVLAAAFGIALSGGYSAFSDPRGLAVISLMALAGVSSGFVLHELGHRFLARRFDCRAEYAMSLGGLALAMASSLFGYIFALPGAVRISSGTDSLGNPTLTAARRGQISIAGPLINLGLALVFLLLNRAFPASLFSLGAYTNAWLAAFNLIPFGPLDGMAVFRWSKMVWLASMSAALLVFLTQYL
jgi:Zn-dependent protease